MADGFSEENLGPTAILDFEQEAISDLVASLGKSNQSREEYLRSAHRVISRKISPIYTLDELQPASVTRAKGNGSCSQRFAVLEAVARSASIPTRVRGLWIAGKFWVPRFRLARPFIPRRILLAWPQFYVGERWLGAECIFGEVDILAGEHPERFANDGESLFDALEHTAIDFEGRTASCPGARCDLSQLVIEDSGVFATRDALFGAFPMLRRSLRGRAFEILFGGRKSV